MAAKRTRDGGRKRKEPDVRLSAILSGLEWEARRAGRLRTAELLKAGRTPLTVIQVAAEAVDAAERGVAQAVQASPPPVSACREGCDWCCHLTVGATAPEVMRIVEHLRSTLSAEEMEALRQRVAGLDDERRLLSPGQRRQAGLPCALLVDRRCSAYPVRPLTCRGFNSSDARRCEQFVHSREVAVPVYQPQMRVNVFMLDGMSAGLEEAKLYGARLELTAALRIALEHPDAFDRWLAGERVFAPAALD